MPVHKASYSESIHSLQKLAKDTPDGLQSALAAGLQERGMSKLPSQPELLDPPMKSSLLASSPHQPLLPGMSVQDNNI